jgi:hypothetical protein
MRKLNLARSAKLLFALAFAVLGPGLMAAKADSIVTVDGTFENAGGTFVGTLEVNTTDPTPATGEFIDLIGSSITVTGGPDAGLYDDPEAEQDDGTVLYLFQASEGGTPSTVPYVDLYFIGSDPIAQASMCTDPAGASCPYGPSQLRTDAAGGFEYDDVEGVAGVPEAGTLPYLALGLAGLGLLFAKRRVVLS